MTEWIKINVGTDPAMIKKWQAQFQADFQKVSKDGDMAVTKLNELCARYGLDPDALK